MKVSYEKGKIIAEGLYHEKARYDLGNEKISVATDGRGGLSDYRVANRAGNLLESLFSLDLSVNGEPLSPFTPKRVEMIGRRQTLLLQTEQGEISITIFLSKDTNGVFFRIQPNGLPLSVALNCRDAKGKSVSDATFIQGQNFLLSLSVPADWSEENACGYFSSASRIDLLFSLLGQSEEHRAAFDNFERLFRDSLGEIEAVEIPSSVTTEEEKALYLSAYFTALQNHKTCGEFNAFAAGVRYIDPLRTYFRDSYFTVLPMLCDRPDLVRDEILTLARGVSEEGACPSAVKSDFTAFWGDHYDSPSFFVIQLYDYLTATGDQTLLDAVINGERLLLKVKKILARLKQKTDSTGLLYKEGEYNKRDWADEVNRNGYVTFVQALYYRALTVASRLFEKEDPALAAEYAKNAARVKTAINDLLFDEQKGYYVNYKCSGGVEDNLSVDTVFTVLFGVADRARATRVLDNMERLLESKNNPLSGAEDFGVLCVYPPYKLPKATCNKSSRPLDYHNGANWCYLTAMYAYAKSLYGRDWRTPLLTTFRYMTKRGHYTPLEYFSPVCPAGSPLQGWSAAIAFVWQMAGKDNFFK